MPLVQGSVLLEKANDHGFAVPAFRVRTPEVVLEVLKVAREEGSPLFISIPADLMEWAYPLVSFIRESVGLLGVYASLHMEGVRDLSSVALALKFGFNSIYLNNRGRSFQESVEFTRKVVSLCTPAGVSVEADVGYEPVTPEMAEEFALKTGVGSLRVEPEAVHTVKGVTNMPVTVGEVSGSHEEVRKVVSAGADSVLEGTRLETAFTNGLREALATGNGDLLRIMDIAMSGVREAVLGHIRACGSSGKVSLLL